MLEPSDPTGDSCCPSCGELLWWFRDRLNQRGATLEELLSQRINVGTDSLDMVELVMELEEEFDVTISDIDAEQIQTIEDLIRYLRRRREEGPS
jgi:acyl carrier protein